MSMTPTFRQRQAGLSLLEVLISALVLSAGLLGLASLQIASMKTTHNSHQMQQATWLVNDLMEQMRANRTGAVAGNYTAATDCTAAPNPLCISSSCNAAQLAAYDLYRIRCGIPGSATSSEVSVRNSLMNGALAVSCVDPDGSGGPLAPDCNQGIMVNLQWNERNAARNTTDFDGNTDGLEAFNISFTGVL